MTNGYRIWVALGGCIIGLFAQSVWSQEAPTNRPSGDLSPLVREQAQKAFDSGMRCFIWKDTNTTVVVEPKHPFFGNVIVVSGVSALARPGQEGRFGWGYALVTRDEKSGEPRRTTSAFKEPSFDISSKNRATLEEMFIPRGDMPTGPQEGKIISGKGDIEIFLLDHDKALQSPSVPISNTLVLEVDLTKMETVK